MESELFLLGHWKNYRELEENLSMPELIATLESYRDKLHQDRKFAAALKGVDLDEGKEGPLEAARRRVRERVQKDPKAPQSGQISFGIGYEVI